MPLRWRRSRLTELLVTVMSTIQILHGALGNHADKHRLSRVENLFVLSDMQRVFGKLICLLVYEQIAFTASA